MNILLPADLFDGDNHTGREAVTVEAAQADFDKRKAQADNARADLELWHHERWNIEVAAYCTVALHRRIAELDA